MPDNLKIIEHPILRRDLTILRDHRTSHGQFRQTLSQISAILAYEALHDLAYSQKEVQTPLEKTNGFEIVDEVVVVPILRAGLGMVDGFVRFLPEARIGHLGMYRDEKTHQPIDYYSSIPPQVINGKVFLVDPMLATGGSAAGAITHLKKKKASHFTFVCLVAAPEGVAHLHAVHPDVQIIAAALDRELDANAYIRPGLGDAGDRIFGTPP